MLIIASLNPTFLLPKVLRVEGRLAQQPTLPAFVYLKVSLFHPCSGKGIWLGTQIQVDGSVLLLVSLVFFRVKGRFIFVYSAWHALSFLVPGVWSLLSLLENYQKLFFHLLLILCLISSSQRSLTFTL